MHRFLQLTLAALLLLPATAADWPRFRGPNGDGLPLKWDAADIAWKTELPGPGSSSPIIVGGVVYLTCYSGYGSDVKEPGDMTRLRRHALCLNRADGSILWNKEIQADGPDQAYTGEYITMHGYASSTPVSDGENVYFFFGPAGVHADTLRGQELWQANVGEKAHKWGNGASPILSEGRFYYVSRDQGTFVVAARPEFELLAQSPPLDSSIVNATPAVADGQFYLRSDRFIYCIGKRR